MAKKKTKKKAIKRATKKKTKKKATKKKVKKKAKKVVAKKKAKKKVEKAPKRKRSKKPSVPTLEEIAKKAEAGYKAPLVNPFVTKDPRDRPVKPDKFDDSVGLDDTVDLSAINNEEEETGSLFTEEVTMEAEDDYEDAMSDFESLDDDDGGYF